MAAMREVVDSYAVRREENRRVREQELIRQIEWAIGKLKGDGGRVTRYAIG
jgi:hypothetical protein